MSYDITVGDFDWNYTSNVSGMWDIAMPEVHLRDMDGMKAEYAAPLLKGGLIRFIEHWPKMEAMNPPNGWGSAEGAFETLLKTWLACNKNQQAVVSVDC